MKPPALPKSLILGVHPSVRGMGWIAFEGPFSAYDWGLVFTANQKNARCLRRFERLLDVLTPEAVVLEAIAPNRRECGRIVALRRAMASTALARGIETAWYAKADVQGVFRPVGARTRQEIAVAVSRQVPALAHRLPRKRGAWDPEDRRMPLFNAAALVVTHFQLDANRLLKELGI